MQADPALVPVLGPEWAKFQDFPGSETVAKLLTKMRDHTMPWLSDTPVDTAMDPQRLMAENQQLKQQLGMATQALNTKAIEQKGKLQIAQVQEDAETQRARAANETKITVAALTGKFETLANAMQLFLEERARLGEQTSDAMQNALDRLQETRMATADQGQAALDRAHEAAMGAADHASAMAQIAATPPPGNGNGQPPPQTPQQNGGL